MYLALYRKWRPKVFDDVISQPYVVTTLKNEIRSKRIGHAYLFTGSRGTGKTTCAKIFAKAVNCLHPENGEPCQKCEICRGLEEGSILDVDEMDAASNNSVDDIRQLREEANFMPASCKYRVYIIDEAHMLSPSAFNAFLKIMEEPPAYVIFILATTEVHKIPPTILSRCQRFDFRRLKMEDIVQRLLFIAKEESLSLSEEAARIIAKAADGSMRDALSLLEQCAAAQQDITAESAIETMGLTGKDQLFSVVDAFLKNDLERAIFLLNELYQTAKDFDVLCEDLLSVFRDILIYQTSQSEEHLLVNTPDDIRQVKRFSEAFDSDRVLFILSQLQEALDKMGKTLSKQLELELCFIRICTLNASAGGEKAAATKAVSPDKKSETPSREKHPAAPLKEQKEELFPLKEEKQEETQEAEKTPCEQTVSLDEALGSKIVPEESNPAAPLKEQKEELFPLKEEKEEETQEAEKTPCEQTISLDEALGSKIVPEEKDPAVSEEEQQEENLPLEEEKQEETQEAEKTPCEQAVSPDEALGSKIVPEESNPAASEGEQQEETLPLKEEKEEETQKSKENETDPKKDEKLFKPKAASSIAQPLSCWGQILETLQEDASHAMIGGFLKDSQALVLDDKLFIQSSVPLVSKHILAKKQLLDQLIYQFSGKHYRLFIKPAKEETEKESSMAKTILQRAEESGIIVEEDKGGIL